MDTQWARYEVFEQDRPDSPHRNTGTVHAPDPEMALQNARDVFVRRPACHSLWVAPAEAIFSKTAEELATDFGRQHQTSPHGEPEAYLIFQKHTQRNTETFVTHVGEVQAHSPAAALKTALETFSHGDVFVWWVCPARVITRSQEDDAPSMFEPATDKPYRQPQYYKVVTQLHQLKRAQEPDA